MFVAGSYGSWILQLVLWWDSLDLAFRSCHGILGILDPVKPFYCQILWTLDPVFFCHGTCLPVGTQHCRKLDLFM